MYQSIGEVQEAYKSGEKLEYLFFWGHRKDQSGRTTKSCLSQWWECQFTVDEVTYSSAEQYMMAEKARLFGDEVIRKAILDNQNPKIIKSLGRKVKNFDERIWKAHCQEIVRQGNLAKFSQNLGLKAFLLGTKEAILVEASPYDCIWGIGMQASESDIQNPINWKGTNYLGFALMWVRKQLIEV